MAGNQKDQSESNTTKQSGSGNFANDPGRASDAGKKGGQQSHGQQSQEADKSGAQQGGTKGGSGNFANDPERASEAGRKGGEHSHGGSK